MERLAGYDEMAMDAWSTGVQKLFTIKKTLKALDLRTLLVKMIRGP